MIDIISLRDSQNLIPNKAAVSKEFQFDFEGVLFDPPPSMCG